MNRQPIVDALNRVDELAREIDQHVPASSPSLAGFRSDLAGLLNVTICATYENCVKLILHEYAGRQNALFETYAKNQYEKINSRIDIGDLYKYSKTFHPQINVEFKNRIAKAKDYYLLRTNNDIVKSYSQILDWRHDFAHAGKRVTTIEEVMKYHKLGKRVILLFGDAFAAFPPAKA